MVILKKEIEMKPEDFVPLKNVSLDLENELLHHMTNDVSVEYLLREGINAEILYSPVAKSIYNFVSHYFNETGRAPTYEVLKVEFPKAALSDELSETAIQWLVDTLRKRYQRNQVQDLAYEIAKRVDEPNEAMQFFRNRALEIERNSMSSRHVWGPGDSKLFLYSLQEKIRQGQYKGVSTGFAPVDKFTGGIRPGQLAFLAARPKRQKTFSMLKAFIEQKIQGNKPILFTLENSEDEMMLRISCMLSGFPWDRAQRGEILPKDWKLLEKAWDEFDSLGEHWIARPLPEERTVPSMILMADKFGADSILISQFRYIEPTTTKYTVDNQMRASVVLDLKNAATRPDNERPILVEAQQTRETDDVDTFEDLTLATMGLTDMIGQAADVVFGLFQTKDMKASNIFQYGIIESRNTDKKVWTVTSEYRKETRIDML